MRADHPAQLKDSVLLRDLAAVVAQESAATASLLAHVGEFDARGLYLQHGHPSMHAYCVGKLYVDEDEALTWVQAARAARQFPALFEAVADGMLRLQAVCLLAPHLTPENSDELLVAAAHKSESEIEQLLARRLPR